jgi:hypothetical protein
MAAEVKFGLLGPVSQEADHLVDRRETPLGGLAVEVGNSRQARCCPLRTYDCFLTTPAT